MKYVAYDKDKVLWGYGKSPVAALKEAVLYIKAYYYANEDDPLQEVVSVAPVSEANFKVILDALKNPEAALVKIVKGKAVLK